MAIYCEPIRPRIWLPRTLYPTLIIITPGGFRVNGSNVLYLVENYIEPSMTALPALLGMGLGVLRVEFEELFEPADPSPRTKTSYYCLSERV